MNAGTASGVDDLVHMQEDEAANMVITVEIPAVVAVDGAGQVEEDVAEDMEFTVESVGAAVQTTPVKVVDAAMHLADVFLDDEEVQCVRM